MANNSYDAYLQKKKQGGYFSSSYDDELAKINPNIGMGIMYSKENFTNAKTPQERADANRVANNYRERFGGYNGGKDGSQYLPVMEYKGTAPVNTGSDQFGSSFYGVGLDSADPSGGHYGYRDWEESQVTETPGSFAYDKFASPYEQQLKKAADAVENRRQWSYNADNDQAYQAARKQFLREADRATGDTMGKYAGMTGGMPSSYAVSAAQQAGDYQRAQLNDRLGDFIQQDYQRYLDNIGLDFDTLSAFRSLDQDERSRYDTDRNFAYNQFMADLQHRIEQEDKAREGRQAITNGRYTNWQNNIGTAYDRANDSAAAIYANENAEEERDFGRAWDQNERDYTRKWNEEERQYSRKQAENEQAYARAMDDYNFYNDRYQITLDPKDKKLRDQARAKLDSIYNG